MENIKIIESNESLERKRFIIPKLLFTKLTKFKKNNLNNLFIYLNIIIIYFLILVIFEKGRKKLDYIKSKDYKNLNSNNFNTISQSTFDSTINKYKRSSIIWPLPKEIKFKPMMSKNELIAFSYFMKPGNIYFEFGSGGSTNLASYYKIKTYSVESDVKWHENLKKNGILVNNITIDLKVKSSGYPGKETTIDDWKRYIQAYKKEYNANIILIDGRFRVACALDIFSKIKNDTLILIHDYGRKEYHILEKFYIKVKMWDSLVLFIKNQTVNSIPESLYNFYLKEKL